MTLDQLAERSQLTASELSKLELGVRPLRVEYLERLAAAMDVKDPRELVHADQAEELFGAAPVAAARQGAGHGKPENLAIYGRVKGDRVVEIDSEHGTLDWSGYQDQADLFVVPMPASELNSVVPTGSLLVINRTFPVREGDLVLRRDGREATIEVVGRGASTTSCSKVVAIWLR